MKKIKNKLDNDLIVSYIVNSYKEGIRKKNITEADIEMNISLENVNVSNLSSLNFNDVDVDFENIVNNNNDFFNSDMYLD